MGPKQRTEESKPYTVSYDHTPLVRLEPGADPVKGRVVEIDPQQYAEFLASREAYLTQLQKIAVLPNTDIALMRKP